MKKFIKRLLGLPVGFYQLGQYDEKDKSWLCFYSGSTYKTNYCPWWVPEWLMKLLVKRTDWLK